MVPLVPTNHSYQRRPFGLCRMCTDVGRGSGVTHIIASVTHRVYANRPHAEYTDNGGQSLAPVIHSEYTQSGED